MATAVARELARLAEERGLHEETILPRMDDEEVVPLVAVAAGMTAQAQGNARLVKPRERLYEDALRAMREAREAVRTLMGAGLIPEPSPPNG